MATSEAQICNKALARIGIDKFIEDLDKTQSREAEIARLFYADERDSLLMQAPWPFAIRRFPLVEIDPAVEPARDGWRHVYKAPNDMLEALYLWPGGATIPGIDAGYSSPPLMATWPLQGVWQNPRAPRPDQRVPFAVEASSKDDSSVILCDFDSPHLIYISQLKDPARFSALFTDALAWHLASVFCMPLAIKPEIQELCEKHAKAATDLAIARHFQGQQEDLPPDSEMIMGRL